MLSSTTNPDGISQCQDQYSYAFFPLISSNYDANNIIGKRIKELHIFGMRHTLDNIKRPSEIILAQPSNLKREETEAHRIS